MNGKTQVAPGTRAGRAVHDVIRSPGRPLEARARSVMESRFGHDFGSVRVHTGSRAADSAKTIGARAYTAGSNVVFGEREYAPETTGGRSLLAHELTHVVQQRQESQPNLEIGSPHDGAEREANHASERVSQPDGAIRPAVRASGIQRAVAPEAAAGPATETAAPKEASPAKDPTESRSAGLIVDDEARDLSPGQMRKNEFLEQLRSGVCAAADAELAAVWRDTKGCPYIERWIGHYREQPAGRVEKAIRKYAPQTAAARSAREYIPLVADRVREGVRRWATTGEITDVPDELKSELPGGGLAGGIGGALGAIGGAIAGAIGGIFGKARPGGLRAAGTQSAVGAELGPGAPLEGSVKSRMETAFAHDFSRVRVHTGPRAAQMSDQLNARAFAFGGDVAFGGGEYRPGTPAGDALIAHELAHVVQQRGGGAASSPTRAESARLEEDADASAIGAVASLWGGAKRGANPRLSSGLSLQRCSKRTTPATQQEADTWIQGRFGRNVAKAVTEGRTASKSVFHVEDDKKFCAVNEEVRNWAKEQLGLAREPVICPDTLIAFVDPRTSTPTEVWVRKSKQKTDTFIHEALHIYSDPQFAGKLPNEIDEGTTEYFARQIANAQDMKIPEDVYPDETNQITLLTDTIGSDEPLIQAYFQGKIRELKHAVNQGRNPLTFEAWRCWMDAKDFDRAGDALRGKTEQIYVTDMCSMTLPPI